MIPRVEKSVGYLFEMEKKGGQGSGNFGHAGIPGQVGGSAGGGGGRGGAGGSGDGEKYTSTYRGETSTTYGAASRNQADKINGLLDKQDLKGVSGEAEAWLDKQRDHEDWQDAVSPASRIITESGKLIRSGDRTEEGMSKLYDAVQDFQGAVEEIAQRLYRARP